MSMSVVGKFPMQQLPCVCAVTVTFRLEVEILIQLRILSMHSPHTPPCACFAYQLSYPPFPRITSLDFSLFFREIYVKIFSLRNFLFLIFLILTFNFCFLSDRRLTPQTGNFHFLKVFLLRFFTKSIFSSWREIFTRIFHFS